MKEEIDASASELWQAVDTGDEVKLRAELERLGSVGVSLLNAAINQGTPALHWAARRGNVAALQALVAYGADVSLKDSRRDRVEGALAWTFDGSTALHWASYFGHQAAVEFLLDQGSDPKAVDKVGGTVLMAAAYSGHQQVCALLLARGADVQQTDRRGETSMHSAAERGHIEVCKYLHSMGLPFAVASRLGTTPFHSAAERGHIDVCRWLVETGFPPETTDTFGRSALHVAAERGQIDICRYLVDDCALPLSSTTRFGSTALHCAAEKGRLELCQWLVKRGASVNVADMARRTADGKTPLHSAAAKGHLSVIQWFVDAGGAARTACWRPSVVKGLVGALDVEGKTFMHYLVEKDELHAGVGNLVRAHRSLADLSDRAGRLPAQVGTKQCVAAVVKALLLFGRYKVKRGEPRHQSETSVIMYASEAQAARDKAGVVKEVKRRLVLKFLRSQEHFLRESETRALLEKRLRAQAPAPGVAPVPVLPLLAIHGSDGVTIAPGSGAGGGGASPSPEELLLDARALMSDFSSVDGEVFLAEGAWCCVMEREESTLRSAIANEMLGCPNWERAREAAAQLASCLYAMHVAGVVHADFKPANAVRIVVGSECAGTTEWRLIDLSSAVVVRPEPGDSPAKPRAAPKFSSAYCPPEMFEMGPDGSIFFKGERGAQFVTEPFDVWAFGVVLYKLCHTRGESLWKEDRADNITEADMADVFRWSNDIKGRRLDGVCTDKTGNSRASLARDLLERILERDPAARLTMAEVARHPFMLQHQQEEQQESGGSVTEK